MKEKIIAITRKIGNFKGFDFDNTFVWTVTTDDDGVDVKVDSHKIKTSCLGDIFGKTFNTYNAVRQLIGYDVISYSYDKYGKLNSFIAENSRPLHMKGGER